MVYSKKVRQKIIYYLLFITAHIPACCYSRITCNCKKCSSQNQLFTYITQTVVQRKINYYSFFTTIKVHYHTIKILIYYIS